MTKLVRCIQALVILMCLVPLVGHGQEPPPPVPLPVPLWRLDLGGWVAR